MNFLDLRNASDEERRLITEILSNSPPANIEFPFDPKSACKLDNDLENGAELSAGNDKNFNCDARNINNIDTNYSDRLKKVASPNIAAPVVPILTTGHKSPSVHVNPMHPMASVSANPSRLEMHQPTDVPVQVSNTMVDSPLVDQSRMAAPIPHAAIKPYYNMQQDPLVQQGLSNSSGPPHVPMQIVIQNTPANQNQPHHRSIHNSQHPQPQPRMPYQSRKHYNNIHSSNSSGNQHHHYQNHFQNSGINNSSTISPNSQNSSDTNIRLRTVNSNDSASSNTSSASDQQQTVPLGYNGNMQQPVQLMQTAKISSKNDQKTMYNQDGSNVQLTSMAGDMNSVMVDMASGQPYAMAPSHVPTFGPQIAYSTPIYPYFFPLPHFPMPAYMIPTNSVVRPGQVTSQQPSTNQPPTSGMQQRQHPPQYHVTNHHRQRHQSPNGDNSSAPSSTMSSDSPRLMDPSKTASSNADSSETTGICDALNNDNNDSKTTTNGVVVSQKTESDSGKAHVQEETRQEKRNSIADNPIAKETDKEKNFPNCTEARGLANGFTSYQYQSRPSYKSRLSGTYSAKAAQESHQASTESKVEENPNDRSSSSTSTGRFFKQQSAKQTRFSENQSRTNNSNSWFNRRLSPPDNVQANSSDSISVKTDEGSKNTTSDEVIENKTILELHETSKRSSPATRDSQSSSQEHASRPLPTATQESSRKNQESHEDVQEPPPPTSAWASSSNSLWTDLFKTKNADGSTSFANENDNLVFSKDTTKDGLINNSNCSTDISTKNSGSNRTKRHPGRYASHESASQAESRKNLDDFAPKLAKRIQEITLKHSLPFLRSRGFINRGNGCYINATLQALVACPPFYNLMHEIGEIKGLRRPNSCTPIIDSFAEFFLNFLPPETNNRKNRTNSNQDQRLSMDELQGEPIEPRCIYNVLGEIKSECLKGAQEDAEEFLSSVLNGLHEEMVDLSELAQSHGGHGGNNSAQANSSDDANGDDANSWQGVGPRNRSLPIRSAKVINTPIQDIFGGYLFSLRTAGKDTCEHYQPFFALQLEISSDNVKSVQDAIKSFTTLEPIHDFYCSKTKQKLDASFRTSLDQLPPILILHLKQFVYTQDQGLRKLVKKIDYPIDFELPESCLHDKHYSDRNRTSKSYKLLAVVYHDGNEAIKGHYLTDVYHIGSSQWIRCDDSTLKVISTQQLLSPDPPRTPYLLFYRRLNTLRIQQSNKK